MMIRVRFQMVVCIGLMLLSQSQPAVAGIAVVMAANSPVTVLKRSEVRAVFLVKRHYVADGARVQAVYQDKDSPLYAAFNALVLDKDSIRMSQYWARLVFSGKSRQVRYLPDDQAVKDFVRDTIGGIGYINSDAVDDSVKIVFEVKE